MTHWVKVASIESEINNFVESSIDCQPKPEAGFKFNAILPTISLNVAFVSNVVDHFVHLFGFLNMLSINSCKVASTENVVDHLFGSSMDCQPTLEAGFTVNSVL